MGTSKKLNFAAFSRRLSTLFKHLFLISVAMFSLAPLLWLLSIAFRPVEETYVIPMKLFPSTLTLENAKLVITMLPKLVMFYRNSFIITFSSVFLILLISSLSGYVFARMNFPGRDIIFWLVVVSMFLAEKHVHPRALRSAPEARPAGYDHRADLCVHGLVPCAQHLYHAQRVHLDPEGPGRRRGCGWLHAYPHVLADHDPACDAVARHGRDPDFRPDLG